MKQLIAFSRLTSSMADLILNDHDQQLDINSKLAETTSPLESLSLLPGLPIDLTIDHIFTKVLSWPTLCSLSRVSKSWHRVISNRKIHDARVRTNSTQTFVVIVHEEYLPLPKAENVYRDSKINEEFDDSSPFHCPLAISLYDPTIDTWSHLPPIPGVAEGVPHEGECVCFKGRVYVLGGLGNTKQPTKEVYMLDLGAGYGIWQHCVSMQRERARFSCHVNGEEIFVFGGTSLDQTILAECEVYNPEKNVWTSIPSMPHCRTDHKVALFEGEFFVHDGLFWKERFCDNEESTNLDDLEHLPHLHHAKFAEVFDLDTQRWRIVYDFKRGMQGPIFEMDGKLVNLSMSINHNYVEIYAGHSNSWISSQPISWNIYEPGFLNKVSFRWPMYVLYQATGLNHEVLVWLFSVQYIENWQKNYLLKSKGLGSKCSNLEWEKMASANEFPEQILCMRQIKL